MQHHAGANIISTSITAEKLKDDTDINSELSHHHLSANNTKAGCFCKLSSAIRTKIVNWNGFFHNSSKPSTLCSERNTHSRFRLYLRGKSLDFYKIFTKCLERNKYYSIEMGFTVKDRHLMKC